MEWKRFGWFLTCVGVAAGLLGVLVADGKAESDRVARIATGVAGNSAAGWYTLAVIGGVAAVVGIGMVISATYSSDE